ncbi:hypothetical protein KUTeg_008149 [Tegillarca granosa]|uniref:VWFD domain-containing protein n=1 Tax=Tegillarca granosa TaxID=220873 RepID=A0ABQ9FD42_TEGGR|nr:hypothetical protein KUTeg_008149 [Tegillarca granosa]
MTGTGTYLGLILWILITAKFNRISAQVNQPCTIDKQDTKPEYVRDNCNKFFQQYIVNGWSLNNVEGVNKPDFSKVFLDDSPFVCNYTRLATVVTKVCCVGYQGVNCDQYKCDPPCDHGTCGGPETCLCDAGWGGKRCNLAVLTDVAQLQYCFADQSCYSPKDDTAQTYSRTDCCASGSGGLAWGNAGGSCIKCANATQTIIEQISPLAFRTCRVSNLVQYRTFDGLYYKFAGLCTYILAQFGDHFTITSHIINPDSFIDMRRKVSIHISGKPPIDLEGGVAKYNGQVLAISREDDTPIGDTNCNCLKTGDWIRVYCQGFRLKVDSQTTVAISVENDDLQNTFVTGQLKGICGNSNGDASDDMITKGGSLTSSAIVFGQSWKTTTDMDCPNTQSFPNYCRTENETESDIISTDARSRCDVIRDKYVFEDCYTKVDIRYWADICENLVCKAQTEEEKEAARCSVVEEFASKCREANVIVEWRQSNRCPRTCPQNMVYKEFASECQMTCRSLHTLFDPDCYNRKTSGCFCANGYVLQQDVCVKISECKCQFREHFYPTGEKIKIGCKSCECNIGTWQCEEDVCDGTCDYFGIGHMNTFDNFMYSFEPAPCRYTLLEMADPNASPFTIEMDFKPCSNYINRNCPNSVTIRYGNTKVVLRTSKEVLISVGSNSLSSEKLPYISTEMHIKALTTEFTEAKFKGGESILWDSRNQLSIRLPPNSYNRKIRGPCGNFNYDMRDEWYNRQNGEEINEVHFAYGYIDEECQDKELKEIVLCDKNTPAHDNAVATCSIIKTSMFEELQVENSELLKFYYEACVQDMCAIEEMSDKKAMCQSLLMLSRQCGKYNINTDLLANASVVESCSEYFHCSYGEFTSCADKCRGSCRDVQFPHPGCTMECIPGCACSNGNLLDNNGICVDLSGCTCVDEYGATSSGAMPVYQAGQTIERQCGTCNCTNATWVCEQEDCDETVICPADQIKLVGQTTLPRTCRNPNPISPPTVYIQCGCAEDKVMTDLKNVHARVVMIIKMLVRPLYKDVTECTRIYVYVDESLKNKVEGMCGSYDDQNTNDLFVEDQPQDNGYALANSFKVDPQCPDIERNLTAENEDTCPVAIVNVSAQLCPTLLKVVHNLDFLLSGELKNCVQLCVNMVKNTLHVPLTVQINVIMLQLRSHIVMTLHAMKGVHVERDLY